MIPMNVYPASSVVPIFFSTYGKTNGESITLTGLAVTDIEIYKGTSTTQRASDAGYTLIDTDGIDVDGVTGIHGFSIDLGDNTDAGFYAVGSFYTVVVSAVTVDSQTVNFIADRFRIAPAEGITGYPKVDVHAFAGTAATVAAGIPEVKVASIANNAVTAAAVADGAIDAATFAAGAITATVIADGAIDAGALAADCITAAKVAADVSAEIADAVWDEDATGHQTGGTFGQAIGDPGADATTIYQSVVTDAAGTNVAADIIAMKVDTAAILVDTAEIGAAGAGLTNINLPNQTMDIVGNITGNLSGSVGSVTGAVGSVTGAVGSVTGAVGSVTGAVGSVTGNVGGNVTGSVGSLAAQAKTDVNTEVLDVMNTDTFAEPGQEAPAATNTLVKKIGYLMKFLRNKVTQTSTTLSVYDDAGTTVDQKATISDDGTTYTRGEIGTGP